MDYSFHLLPLLVAIIEEKHLGRAGTRVNFSQPAVSRALAKLREQYQDPLVIRTAKGVEPTAFALQIYPSLLEGIKQLETTFSANQRFDPHNCGLRFSIACSSLANYSFIPKIVENFSQNFPLIGIDIHILAGDDMVSQLRNKEHDFVIDVNLDDSRVLNKTLLYNEDLVLCCRKEHPRIQNAKISLQQFMSEYHVTIANRKSSGNLLKNEHIEGLDERKVAITTLGEIESLCLVGITDYVCLADMSNVLLFEELFSIKAVQLPFDKTSYGIYLYWHPSRDNDNALTWFRNELMRLANV